MSSLYTLDEQLIIALKKKDYDGAEQLLTDGADINARNIRGETPLFFFANAHSMNTILWLIERGADLDIASDLGETPLFSAVTRSEALVVDALLTAGANPNIVNTRKIAPLMQAVLAEKDHGVLERLLEAMPDIDPVSDSGTTPLLAAAARGKSKYVELLLNAGANPETVDYLGQGLLHAAILSQDPSVLRTVVDKAPLLDPNYAARSGTTAMSLTLGSPQMTEMLLDMGGDPNAKSANRMNEGYTLLMAVLGQQHPSLPFKKDKNGQTAIQVAMAQAGYNPNAGGGGEELVGKMLAKGANPAQRDEAGHNAGFSAIMTGAVQHLPALIAHGLDPARPMDPASCLPYDALTFQGIDLADPEAIELISQWHSMGFPFERPQWDEALDGPLTADRQKAFAGRDQTTILAKYAAIGFWDGLKRCIDLGANVNAADLNGATLLHHLAASQFDGLTPAERTALKLMSQPLKGKKAQDPEALAQRQQELDALKAKADAQLADCHNLLINQSSQWNAATDGGNTPLHIAARVGSAAWAKFLLDQGADPTLKNALGLTPAGVALKEGHTAFVHALTTVVADAGTDLRAGLLRDTVQASEDNFFARQKWTNAIASLPWTPEQLNAVSADGETALTIAAATDQPDIIRVLLKLGADPNVPGAQGNTALMQAAFAEAGEAIRLLRAGGAKMNQENAAAQTVHDVSDFVKSMYVHKALKDEDLSELMLDLENRVPTERDKAMEARHTVSLENIVRQWRGEPLLELPPLPEKEKPADPVAAAAADPSLPAPSDPAVDPSSDPSSVSRPKGP